MFILLELIAYYCNPIIPAVLELFSIDEFILILIKDFEHLHYLMFWYFISEAITVTKQWFTKSFEFFQQYPRSARWSCFSMIYVLNVSKDLLPTRNFITVSPNSKLVKNLSRKSMYMHRIRWCLIMLQFLIRKRWGMKAVKKHPKISSAKEAILSYCSIGGI